MDELKIEYVDINSIKPYRRNAKRHPKDQIEKIKASMQAVGNLDPIGVWRGEIVEGHGRWLAARELGMDKVPVIRLDMLTDEQRKYYGLAHNKITMESEFDTPVLNLELMELADTGLDLTLVGFDAPKGNKRGKAKNHTDREEDPLPRLQHNVFDNFDRDFWPDVEGKYDIPVMEPIEVSGTEFLRFCDWKEADDVSGTIAHFYYDDYKFMTAWRDPDAYVDRLRHFKAVVAPDFSLYTDFPMALQIMSCYRRQWVGAYWQSLGLTVIPDVVWGEERSWEFCFDGIPQGGMLGGTFSTADLNNFANYGVRVYRAAAPEGTYSISKGRNFDSSGLKRYYAAEHAAAQRQYRADVRALGNKYSEVTKAYRAGTATRAEADRAYKDYQAGAAKAANKWLVANHNALIAGQRQYGYTYSLERRK